MSRRLGYFGKTSRRTINRKSLKRSRSWISSWKWTYEWLSAKKLNGLAPSNMQLKFWMCHFQTQFGILNISTVNSMGAHLWQVKISSGNGLVLSGHRPSPEPMLTKVICQISRSHRKKTWNDSNLGFPRILRRVHGRNALKFGSDLSWPPSKLIRFWSWSVNFPDLGAMLT